MNQSLIYDIRTSENALSTLVNFTGIVPPIWEKNIPNRNRFQYDEDLVENIISKYGHFTADYETWFFIYFHITTSANKCVSFKKHGILDLKNSYLCPDSELRGFLDKKGILIDIDNHTLSYKGRIYDISYEKWPPTDREAYASWLVGRKFYFDYTTCGFLSVWDKSPYGGYIHLRPEILSDIDNLLGLTLSQEWQITHKPYEIIAAVNGSSIVYGGRDDCQSSKDKILYYLTKAYTTAFGSPHEEIILMKNNIQISPTSIIEIKPLSCW